MVDGAVVATADGATDDSAGVADGMVWSCSWSTEAPEVDRADRRRDNPDGRWMGSSSYSLWSLSSSSWAYESYDASRFMLRSGSDSVGRSPAAEAVDGAAVDNDVTAVDVAVAGVAPAPAPARRRRWWPSLPSLPPRRPLASSNTGTTLGEVRDPPLALDATSC